MLGRIRNIEQRLHKELDTKIKDKEKILKMSEELDKLILEYDNKKNERKSKLIDWILQKQRLSRN